MASCISPVNHESWRRVAAPGADETLLHSPTNEDYKARLAAIEIDDWPVSDQIDHHLVRAEMNGLDFHHRVTRPWSRDPAFYLMSQGGAGPAMSGFRTLFELEPPEPLPSDPSIDHKAREREILPGESHEYVGHMFDDQRRQRDERPIRGGDRRFNMEWIRMEGWAVALEELLMQAGVLDERPRRGREVEYLMNISHMSLALPDLAMHANLITFDESRKLCAALMAKGWSQEDERMVWYEMESTLRFPGFHTGVVVGKAHFMKLFRERAMQLGDDFVLRDFIDEFLAGGIIPISLIRWEMTGYDDEIRFLMGDEARRIIERTLDAGVNLIDLGHIYGDGRAERIVGSVLKETGRRHEVVISTKVYPGEFDNDTGLARSAHMPGRNPNEQGLSRAGILNACDAALRRLQTDYIDLYYARRVTDRAIQVGVEFGKLAAEAGITPAQLAILWCKDQPGVTAPLIGPRTCEHLEELVAVREMTLDPEIAAACDALVPPGSAVSDFHNTSGWMKTQLTW